MFISKAFLLAFVVLGAGCLTSSRLNSLENQRNAVTDPPKISSAVESQTNDNIKLNDLGSITKHSDYLGCWGGTKGGSIGITGNEIYDPKGKKRVSYKEILKKDTDTGPAFLLELEKDPELSCLGKYVLLKIRDDIKSDDNARFIWIYSYPRSEDYFISAQDLEKSKFSGWGEFAEINCKAIGERNITKHIE